MTPEQLAHECAQWNRTISNDIFLTFGIIAICIVALRIVYEFVIAIYSYYAAKRAFLRWQKAMRKMSELQKRLAKQHFDMMVDAIIEKYKSDEKP